MPRSLVAMPALGALALLACAIAGAASPANPHVSPYVGEQARAIKSLSEQDVDDLLAGRGAGWAKAAELNGYPGPAHVLELKERLGLSASQIAATESLMARHRAVARRLGEQVVASERALDRAFANRTADESSVRALTATVAACQGDLRAEHLKTHLEQTALLTPEQVRLYAELRGYARAPGSADSPAAPASGAAPAAPHHHAPGHDLSSTGAHDMSSMQGPANGRHAMTSALGPYPMTREGSGTSWLPDATPMTGVHTKKDDWSLMAHGIVNAVHDRQSGPRGDDKLFTQSMLMLMAQRPAATGTLGARAMFSLDPAHGKSGYPLLFQTGETADGRAHLVDRQHPHDFVMELSASYSVRLGENGSAFAYIGLPGEPALGPPAFMHRFSAMRNPEAPLTHHWLDSTHITFGVATLGASRGPLQVEASWFNGREPDQHRWNVETRTFDSWSARVSFNPSPALSMQVSHGDLKSPEQLDPQTRVRRTTASITYHRKAGDDDWATTLAWGRNRKSGPHTNRSEPGWLLESTYVLRDRHTFFARAEQVANGELFEEGEPLHGETFRIRKLSLGYVWDFARTGPVRWGIGGLVGVFRTPSRLDPVYGGSPRSTMVFLQGRL